MKRFIKVLEGSFEQSVFVGHKDRRQKFSKNAASGNFAGEYVKHLEKDGDIDTVTVLQDKRDDQSVCEDSGDGYQPAVFPELIADKRSY